MKKIIAMILAGGRSHSLSILERTRTTTSIPFGGKYRIIDFPLSNCVNSDIYTVGIMAQYTPFSLMDHIGIGKPWDRDRANGGVQILQPFLSNANTGWYRGTADALYQNQDYILNNDPKYTLVLSGDQIYKMDYRKMLQFHIENKAPVTMAVTRVSREFAQRCGVVTMDSQNKIRSIVEKPQDPPSDLVNMGIYLFDTEVLLYKLQRIGRDNRFDILYHMLMDMIDMGEVYAYEYKGYWRDIGTISDYWRTSMDIIDHQERLSLNDKEWTIHTTTERKPPVRFGKTARVINSVIANGSVVNGYVEHSIIFPGVYIGKEARVINSIVMHRSVINEGCCIIGSIIDKVVHVGADTSIGWQCPQFEAENHFKVMDEHLTVIGKCAEIPAQAVIGKNCIIDAFTQESDFTQLDVPDGSTIHGKEQK